jgi:hypothetical protein
MVSKSTSHAFYPRFPTRGMFAHIPALVQEKPWSRDRGCLYLCGNCTRYLRCLESGIGISVPVMDACVGALSLTLDISQHVLPAWNIGLFKEGWSEFCRSISALFQAEHSGPVSKSPTSMQYIMKEFRNFCAQRPELQNCVDTVKRFISGK